MNSERMLTNSKVKQKRLLKKRDICSKEHNTEKKEEFNKDMENLRKKQLYRNPGNKKFLKSNKKL
jgi:hypothetical protein